MMDRTCSCASPRRAWTHEVSLIKAMGLNGLRARGRRPARRLLRRDGQAGPARLRRLPVLQLLGRAEQLDRQGPRRQLQHGAHARPSAAQPPQRDLLQLERQHPRAPAQEAGRHQGHEGRRLRHPADGLGGVQVDDHARPVGHEGRPVQLVPAELRVQPQLLRLRPARTRARAARSSTAAAPGASRPSPARARPCRRWTRSIASCRRRRRQQMVTSPNLRLFNSGRGGQDSGTSYSSFQHIGVPGDGDLPPLRHLDGGAGHVPDEPAGRDRPLRRQPEHRRLRHARARRSTTSRCGRSSSPTSTTRRGPTRRRPASSTG